MTTVVGNWQPRVGTGARGCVADDLLIRVVIHRDRDRAGDKMRKIIVKCEREDLLGSERV